MFVRSVVAFVLVELESAMGLTVEVVLVVLSGGWVV